jgi:HPt (histidine-containing phosphotransfer) domain-containing protein
MSNSPVTIDRKLALLDPVPMEEAFGEIDEMALETYGIFLSSTEPLLDQMKDGIASGDLAAASDAAHSAKGAARMTGAFQLAQVCSEIEKYTKAGDGALAGQWLDLVPQAFAEVASAIEQVQLSGVFPRIDD